VTDGAPAWPRALLDPKRAVRTGAAPWSRLIVSQSPLPEPQPDMETLAVEHEGARWTCFGVTVEIDSNDPGSQKVASACDELNNQFAIAIENVREALVADRLGRATDRVSASESSNAAPENRSDGAGSVSLLDDCGLPIVRLSGDFLSGFLDQEVATSNLPFVGFRRSSLDPLWAPPILLQIISINFRGLTECYDSLHYLTRMNSNDPVWLGSGQQAWFSAFGSGLRGYMTELYSGRFVDRSGTGISFDVKGGLAGARRTDPKQVAPQLAGAIVAALCEFLGDQLFHVPFWSSDILKSYRDLRDRAASAGGIAIKLKTLTDAVRRGTIAEADAGALLGTPKGGGDLAVVFEKLPSGVADSPVVASGVARMVLRKIDQLDSDYLAALLGIAPQNALLDSIEEGQSAFQDRFTCFKTGVIRDYMINQFIPDPRPGKQGAAGRDRDTARLSGDTTDYSDLLGRLVAFGGETAEKSVKSLVGGLIRGIAIAALQNELIAEFVASLAGTLAKKLVESITYQAYQQFIDSSDIDPDAKRAVLNALGRFHGPMPA
jgi:hypothetical protein